MEKQKETFLTFTSQKVVEDAVSIAHYHKDSFHAGYPLHKHDFFELLYFISGAVDYEVSKRIYPLQKNDVLIIHPQQLHQPHILPSKDDYERIVLWISKPYLQQLCEEKPEAFSCLLDLHPESEPCLLRAQVDVQAHLRTLFFDLSKALPSQKNEEQKQRIIKQLMSVLSTLPKPHDFRWREGNSDQALMEIILRFLDEHFCEDLSLENIASRFFINKFYFVHQFTDRVGLSPYRYIMQKRLNLASERLLQGMKTKEVALSCGFKDYANFYRAFKTAYKESPSEYVKKHKADSK